MLGSLAAAGMSIYFEAGDHWGFQHVSSTLDDRDGIASALDGDDSFELMDGQNSGQAEGDYSGSIAVTYVQDQAAFDYTDQLTLGGDIDVTGGALWRNSAAAPDDYITGAHAVHTDGGVMISTSWEFGGYGDAADQEALATAYLTTLGRTSGDMEFARGDCNNDGGVNIADVIYLLGNLFPGGLTPPFLHCVDAGGCQRSCRLSGVSSGNQPGCLTGFRIEPHDFDSRPVSCALRPTLWVRIARLLVDVIATAKNLYILTTMALFGCDEADGAVPMLLVVPGHKPRDPGSGGLERQERSFWVFRTVLSGPKKGLGVGVVVADTRSTK